MKGLVDRDKLFEILAPVSSSETMDIDLGSGTAIQFRNSGEENLFVDIGKRSFRLTDEIQCDAARAVGLHETYYKKSPSDLIQYNLNFWFNKSIGPMRFLLSGDELVGITQRIVPIANPIQLAEEVEKAVGKNRIMGYHYPHADMDYVKIPAILDFKRDVGDLPDGSKDDHWGGLFFQTSITGASPVMAGAYFVRQVCTNGAVVCRELMKWSRKNTSYSSDE